MENYPKVKMTLVPMEWVAEMAAHLEKGLKDGRKPYDWIEKYEDREDELVDKIMRHLWQYQSTGGTDHLLAIACDTMILHSIKEIKR